jgi:hypothetical protein
LTVRLLPILLAAPASRVVTLSSLAHRSGRIDFDDLQSERDYNHWSAYGQSKLATLMFSMELERRARTAGWRLVSNAAHPGWSRTGLQSAGPRMGRNDKASLQERLGQLIEPFFAQSAQAGALPTLYAATAPDAEGGVLYGPDGFYELRGMPSRAKIASRALDRSVWTRLWAISEGLTGLRFPAHGSLAPSFAAAGVTLERAEEPLSQELYQRERRTIQSRGRCNRAKTWACLASTMPAGGEIPIGQM